MLLIIVGAGATYDSDSRRRVERLYSTRTGERQQLGIDWRPPLAKDLFDEDRFGKYVASYPPSQGLMEELRKSAPAVEEALERIRDRSKDQEHLPRQLLAMRYYLRDVIADTVGKWNEATPDKMTNFTRLLTQLEPWRQQREKYQGAPERVAIVTFNYDTLFDEALTNLLPHFPLVRIEDYVSDPRYQLFKLHGSVNWWRDVRGAIVGNQEWTVAVTISPPRGWAPTLFDPPAPFTESGAFRVYRGGQYSPCVPCLALPTATKGVKDFACPDTHLADLGLLRPQVTDVLILGWKGVEGHFLEEWRLVQAVKPDPKIHSLTVVDATHEAAADVAYRVVQKVGMTPQTTPTFETFSGFVIDKLDAYLHDMLSIPAA